ncbi:MAG: glycosyltransferase family 4 protein [Fibrobacter sp.]|nr:glycosyltransferase family 4 protein [Fibrobacter sp.]
MMYGDNAGYPRIRSVLMTADTVGGVWQYSIELARYFCGHDIHVFLVTMGALPDRAQRSEIASLKHITLYESSYKLEWMDDPWADVERAGAWLLDIQDAVNPQIVHLNGYSHGDLPWRVPVVVVGHSCVYSWFQSVCKTSPGPEWQTYKMRVERGLNSSNHVVAPSRAMLEWLQAIYQMKNTCSVIYNGCNSEIYKPLPKEPFVFTAGRIWDEAKNISTVIKCAGNSIWPVFIAGDAGKRELTSVPNVKYMGKLESRKIARVMGKASIYVAPCRYEPFGLSILEAALCGCALVLGDIESLREIWGDSALFVDPGNSDCLSGKINLLIKNDHLRFEMSQKARIRALEFSPGKMAIEYLSLYQRLIEECKVISL